MTGMVRDPFIERIKIPDTKGPVLVTGGTGFLGSHIVRLLQRQGRAVSVLARSVAPHLAAEGVRVIQAGLHDTDAVLAACKGMSAVFHTAARVGVWGSYLDFHEDNVEGTRAIIEGCRRHEVPVLVYTSTPSVVYNGHHLRGANERLPLTDRCPSPYPLTKAVAERLVNEADRDGLRTVSLRPHLIWGIGDRHLIPRVLSRADAGRLRIVGNGMNQVDMVHVANAAAAHLFAESALTRNVPGASGRGYFITNGEPVCLWQWINGFLQDLGRRAENRRLPLALAYLAGSICETVWTLTRKTGEPPMTRFIATELAKDHWFDITAARTLLGYAPEISMAEGTAALVAHLRAEKLSASRAA